MESDYQVSRLLWLRAGFLKNVGPAQHARDRPGQVVLDRRLGARRRRRRAGARRQRLLGRVSRRPLLSQLQGRGDLRGHARGAHADAGRLRARLPAGSGRRAASCRPCRRQLPPTYAWTPTSRSSSSASSSRRPSPAPRRWGRATATRPTRPRCRRCGASSTRVPIDGTIVIGEGERDEAPMLFIGEKVGLANVATGPARARRATGRYRRRSARRHQPLRHRRARCDRRARGVGERRAPPRARPLHGEADRPVTVSRRGRSRCAGRRQPAGDRHGAEPRRR